MFPKPLLINYSTGNILTINLFTGKLSGHYLRFTITKISPKDLTQFADVSEGIENALIKYAKISDSFLIYESY